MNILNLYAGNDFIETSLILASKLKLKKIFTLETSSLISNFRLKKTRGIDIITYPAMIIPKNVMRYKSTYNKNFENYISDLELLVFRYHDYIGITPSKKQLSLYVNHFLVYAKTILEKNHINIVIFDSLPHTPLTYAIMIVCEEIGIRQVYVNYLRDVPGIRRSVFLTDTYQKFSLNHEKLLQSILLNSDNLSLNDLNEEWRKIYSFFSSKTTSTPKFTSPLPNKKNNSKRKIIFKNLVANFKFHRIIVRIKMKIKNFFSMIRYFFTINYLNKLEISEFSMMNSFIFIPLHFQPEDSTIPIGGFFSNQLQMIRYIRENTPKHIPIYVKEHPAYWLSRDYIGFSNYRSISFYNEILRTENAFLVSHSFQQEDLIRNADLICTITGTVTLEALSFNKNVVLFSDHFFNYLPNTTNYRNYNYEHLLRNKISDDYLLATLSFFEKISFPTNLMYSTELLPHLILSDENLLMNRIAHYIENEVFNKL